MKNKLSYIAVNIAHVILFFILIAFVINIKRYPYADDWTYVNPLNMHSGREFVDWLFAQHVDHRIPIQKLVQYGLARLFGYDFGILILFNVFIACVASIALCAVARTYRGYQHYGDLIIPLIMLAPAAGYSLWAFQLQFLSSVFFVSIAAYFALKYEKTGKILYFVASIFQLLFCALCGINGVIFSVIISAGLCVYLFWRRHDFNKKYVHLLAISLLVLILNVVILALWTPSSASNADLELSSVLEIIFKLLSASMITFMFDGVIWKSAVVVSLLLGTVYTFWAWRAKRKLGLPDLFLVLCLLSSFMIVLSVAVGRGKTQGGWSNGLAMHYGYLTIFLPIFSWVMLSKKFEGKLSELLSVALVIIFIFSYKENYNWRANYLQSILAKQQSIYFELNTDADIKELVNKYALDFTWKDEPIYKQKVVDGISTLRKHDYPIYKLSGSK